MGGGSKRAQKGNAQPHSRGDRKVRGPDPGLRGAARVPCGPTALLGATGVCGVGRDTFTRRVASARSGPPATRRAAVPCAADRRPHRADPAARSGHLVLGCDDETLECLLQGTGGRVAARQRSRGSRVGRREHLLLTQCAGHRRPGTQASARGRVGQGGPRHERRRAAANFPGDHASAAR
jgi:hypothetical protein